jgi:putative alpha-1,2-mannosidase
MAKAVADTRGQNQAGFAFDSSVVTGFSHMHDSGTGGVRHLGELLEMNAHIDRLLRSATSRFLHNLPVPATTSTNVNGS